MTINILIAFVLIYIGHQTRNLEISNSSLKHKIDEKEHAININQIEFSLHNDNKYLKKLFSIFSIYSASFQFIEAKKGAK